MIQVEDKKKAFTLVELLIAISIFSIFGVIFANLMIYTLASVATLTEKSFFVNERSIALQAIDQDMSYAATLSSADGDEFTISSEGFSNSADHRVVTYNLTQDGEFYDFTRKTYDPSDLTTPLREITIFSQIASSETGFPKIEYEDDSGTRFTTANNVALTAAQLTSVNKVILTLYRNYTTYKDQISGENEFIFTIYKPTN
ncbi:MAG: type II secretion system protein [Verrucomicrobiota bacterium]